MTVMVDKLASPRVIVARGRPLTEGTYAAEVYFGWKLLERRDGEWWHPDCVGRWTAGEPLQWVGPLPQRQQEKVPPVFDL